MNKKKGSELARRPVLASEEVPLVLGISNKHSNLLAIFVRHLSVLLVSGERSSEA